MISLQHLLIEILIDKNAILYLGWIKRNNHDIIGFDVQSGEDETHHNYLQGLPPEWRGQSDNNLIRWRYRRDINTIYWWECTPPKEDEKQEVERWIEKNLKKSHPTHRLLLVGKQQQDPNFCKSHGED